MGRGGLLVACGLVLALTGALPFYMASTYYDYRGWRSGLLHSPFQAAPGSPGAEFERAQLNAILAVGLGILIVASVLLIGGFVWLKPYFLRGQAWSSVGASKRDPTQWLFLLRHGYVGIILVGAGIALLVTGLALSFLVQDALYEDLIFGLHRYIGPPPVVYGLILAALVSLSLGLRIITPGSVGMSLRAGLPLILLALSLLLPWWMIYEWVGGPGGQLVLWFLGNRIIYVDTPGQTATEMVVTFPSPALYAALALVSLGVTLLGYSNWTRDGFRWVRVFAAAMTAAALPLAFLVLPQEVWVFPGSYNGKMLYDGLGPGWFLGLLSLALMARGVVKERVHKESRVAA